MREYLKEAQLREGGKKKSNQLPFKFLNLKVNGGKLFLSSLQLRLCCLAIDQRRTYRDINFTDCTNVTDIVPSKWPLLYSHGALSL